jgi:probable HAF family extracellular repeat protein
VDSAAVYAVAGRKGLCASPAHPKPMTEDAMPRRLPLSRWRALAVTLAVAIGGCADDEITAPQRGMLRAASSQTVTYTNGDVSMTDLGIPAGAFQALALGINDLGTIFGHVRTNAHPPCAAQLQSCNVAAFWTSYQAMAQLVSDPTHCVNGPDAGSIWSINNVGVAVGISVCLGSSRPHGYVLDASSNVRRLPGLIGPDDALATDINDFGIAVGRIPVAYQNGFPVERAAMWNVSGPTITVTNLGDPNGGFTSAATAVNNAGTVVGYKHGFTGAFHAFVRQPGGPLVDIGTLPGDLFSLAAGINQNGVVVGYSQSSTGVQRGFVWTSATGMQAIGTLGGTQSFAQAVNDAGVVVGRSTTATGQMHAFAWKDGVMMDLGVLPGHTMSDALAINVRGEIVGTSCCTGSSIRAVRWTIGNPGTTPPGEGVSVQPNDETTGEPAPVLVTFDDVTGGGTTTVTSGSVGESGGPPAPGGFRLGAPATQYNVETTATFNGSVTLCFNYSGTSYGNESVLRLLHFEDGGWNDVTTSLDTTNNIICGSVTSLSPFLVAEANASPAVTAIGLPAAPIPVGTSINVSASFTDANPGDTHTANIVWDDGTTSSLNVSESGGSGTAAASHTYTTPGVYTVQVSVSDGDLTGVRASSDDQPAYIVVFDPSSGFVTGGGWIDSPSGSCLWGGCAGDGSTLGKATFGFVSRYKNGAVSPSGNTEFQFKAGGLAFSSTSYQWLVVAGARAHYKGEGEIAGSIGSYGFLVTAIDGALDGGSMDRFRIKIWDKTSGVVVYDNKMGSGEDSADATALGGGSIVIHR